MFILNKIFGDQNKRYLNKLKPVVEKINSLERDFEKFSDLKVKEKTKELKDKLKSGKTLDDILVESFALVREAAKRTLHQRHYDVQLIGGIVLHQGKIAEMLTGEGKTLTAVLPAFLNSLSGKGVHIVTVNDYLARRDTVWMGQIYNFLGQSVGCITQNQSFLYDPSYKKPPEEKEKIRDELGSFYVVEDFLRPCSKKEAYLADITYGTNTEFGFDYLRDNMVFDLKEKVQRDLNFVIIDEVDSVLIDEARTPLIISQPELEKPEDYYFVARIVENLKENEDFILNEKEKTVFLTESGQSKIIRSLGKDPWKENDISFLKKLDLALKAKVFYLVDRDYVIKDNKVVIVDEFTGRLLPQRRFSEGLHQAIEAKEHIRGAKNIQVMPESKTIATISIQNYFLQYKKIAGMTGTAKTAEEEFYKVYGLEVVSIPPNKPMIRKDFPDRIYKTEKEKFKAIISEIKKSFEKGQPVLVGTRSIEKNEYLSMLLKRENIPHQILNAKNHEREGQIIAQAGKLKSVTIATNMAGRGVDIILGGNPPDQKEAKVIKNLGGLYVIGTERHEDRRIDNQLRGRSGRQGDPGMSRFFVSLEDDLIRIFGGDRIKLILDRFNFPDDQPIENKLVSNIIESAQKKIEGYNFDIRSHLLKYDNVLTKQRETIYKKRDDILKDPKGQLIQILKTEIADIIDYYLFNQDNLEREKNKKLKETFFESIVSICPLKPQELLEIEKILEEKISKKELKDKLFSTLVNFILKHLKEKEEKTGKEDFLLLIKFVSLKFIDSFWSAHLSYMDYLKETVNLKAYAQKDPLVEYGKESYALFQELLKEIRKNITQTIFKVELSKTIKKNQEKDDSYLSFDNQKNESKRNNEDQYLNFSKKKKKVGRNEPCPCGSGKKYKNCCWPKYGY